MNNITCILWWKQLFWWPDYHTWLVKYQHMFCIFSTCSPQMVCRTTATYFVTWCHQSVLLLLNVSLGRSKCQLYWHWNAPGSNFTIRGSWYINYTHIFIRYNIRGQAWAHLVTFLLKCLYQSRKERADHLTCRGGLWFFFRNSALGYMTKTLIQIFFSFTKIRLFFSAILGIRIFF